MSLLQQHNRYAVDELAHPSRGDPSMISPCYITVKRLQGRLGNHMFIYASFRGIARYSNCTPVLFSDREETKTLLENFTLFPELAVNSSQISKLVVYSTIGYNRCCSFSPQLFEKVRAHKSVKLRGFLQSFKYFEHIAEIVRAELTPKLSIMDIARDIIQWKTTELRNINHNVMDVSVIYIAVHVRRGDMTSSRARKAGFNTPNATYYLHAMDSMRKRFGNVIFLLLGNGPKWTMDNIAVNSSDTVLISQNKPVVDMAVMSLCNHTIMSVGSFGWWGSYLAKGETVYYGDHPIPNTFIGNLTVKEDYYPREWTGMT